MPNTYYWTCPYCGDNNDPGETCDCQKIKTQEKVTITNQSEEEGDNNEERTL